jgi:hypothetical protein
MHPCRAFGMANQREGTCPCRRRGHPLVVTDAPVPRIGHREQGERTRPCGRTSASFAREGRTHAAHGASGYVRRDLPMRPLRVRMRAKGHAHAAHGASGCERRDMPMPSPVRPSAVSDALMRAGKSHPSERETLRSWQRVAAAGGRLEALQVRHHAALERRPAEEDLLRADAARGVAVLDVAPPVVRGVRGAHPVVGRELPDFAGELRRRVDRAVARFVRQLPLRLPAERRWPTGSRTFSATLQP